MNVQETLPILLRLLDQQEFAKCNGVTPTTLDFLGNYSDGIEGCFFVIDQQQNADGQINRRPVVYMHGATETRAADNLYEGTRPRSFISYPSNVLSHDMNRQIGNVYYPRPCGAWKLQAIYAIGVNGKRTVVLADTTYNICASRCTRADYAFSVYLRLR